MLDGCLIISFVELRNRSHSTSISIYSWSKQSRPPFFRTTTVDVCSRGENIWLSLLKTCDYPVQHICASIIFATNQGCSLAPILLCNGLDEFSCNRGLECITLEWWVTVITILSSVECI
ncbi:uncharacterized protein [Rutidosis leptorrhynchoides]|uniref:uncharacterized protein isoform X2 n=1 Tax=Rutidosis leptorrhynchoides TaxID=125765 RepID=UPI003A99775C